MKDILFELSAKPNGGFSARLGSLTEKLLGKFKALGLGPDHLVWSRIYLSDAANQLEAVKSHTLYRDILSQGACSFVEQPPLDGSKIGLMVSLTPDAIERIGTAEQRIVKCGATRHLFQTVHFTVAEAAAMTVRELTVEAFHRHGAWLEEEGLSLRDNCVRTWLFVRDIDTNYHEVVEGRNEVFREYGLTPQTHFIASTGIDGNSDNVAAVCIDFWSVDDEGMKVQYLHAQDHLNPTSEYGVAFERGTRFISDGVERILISGTASIDKAGNCLFMGDVVKQAGRLFDNIRSLLADGGAGLEDITAMNVYLRDFSDHGVIKALLNRRFPCVPRVITLAPVCRPQWLIETECIVSRSAERK